MNEEGWYAARMIVLRREELRRLFTEGQESRKYETLRRMTANLTKLIDTKQTERDKYLAGVGTAKDVTVISGLVELAEKASQEMKGAQDKLAELRPALESLNTRAAALEYTMTRLEGYSTFEQLDAMPLEEKRFLLDLIGLKLTVHPSGTKLDLDLGPNTSGRIKVDFRMHASDASLL